jgi:hypothetical protein
MEKKYKFASEEDVEEKFFAIKNKVMEEYGYEGDDFDEEEYENDEDEIMGEANDRFYDQYGYEHYTDAMEEGDI